MQLADAKFKRNGATFRLTLLFRNQILDAGGKTKMQEVKMAFLQNMPLEDFTAGLRNLADHIDNEIKPSLIHRALKVVTRND